MGDYFKVGETQAITVAVEGVVTAVGDDTVTIGSLTLPTSLGPMEGVTGRYLSLDFPPPRGDFSPESYCNHVDPDVWMTPVRDAIAREHNENHDMPAQWCSHHLCVAARVNSLEAVDA